MRRFGNHEKVALRRIWYQPPKPNVPKVYLYRRLIWKRSPCEATTTGSAEA